MSIDIDPKKFAELVVTSDPAKSDDAKNIAKESLTLYISAYHLTEKYVNIAINCYDTTEALREINEVDLQLR